MGVGSGATLGVEGVRGLSLSPEAALAAGLLEREGFPGDPADRMIYATARTAGVRLHEGSRPAAVRQRRHGLVAENQSLNKLQSRAEAQKLREVA